MLTTLYEDVSKYTRGNFMSDKFDFTFEFIKGQNMAHRGLSVQKRGRGKLPEEKCLIPARSILSTGTLLENESGKCFFYIPCHRRDYFNSLEFEKGRGREGLYMPSLQLNAQ